MVDLIAGFAPEGGAEKIIGFIRKYGDFREIGSSEGDSRSKDLHLHAMRALEKYIPSGPLHRSQAGTGYDSYIRTLENQLAHDVPEYRSYAALRLHELGELPIRSAKMLNVVTQMPVFLNELISAVFSLSHYRGMERDLGFLYIGCSSRVDVSASAFEKAVALADGQVLTESPYVSSFDYGQESGNLPAIRLPSGVVVQMVSPLDPAIEATDSEDELFLETMKRMNVSS